MKRLRIGLIDLDTSHPGNWLPIIRELGHEVVGVFDGGTVFPNGYAEQFALEKGISNVYQTVAEMVEDVDVAIVHSCNWDLHIDRAAPFIAAGKGVLIDKPLAGNPRHLRTLLEWERQGARITGGSSLRFCQETVQWKMNHTASGISYVTAGCGVDEFNYGIHAYAMLAGIMGPGIEGVRHLGESGQRHVEIVWRDGRRGLVAVGAVEGSLPFYATVVTGQDVSHFQADSRYLYRALLEASLPYLAGADAAAVPLEELVEAEYAAIAAAVSKRQGGTYVRLAELAEDEAGYDGSAFSSGYRKLRLGIV
ncbi:Gfo/Idh/MocA family oxidoreductase [Paenibacillus solisilvae]|uniref:Gfo/Idh/MocA family oxidoreductase n=1 Tax=Paenibacillus solisilvae TaxID=2486751 RepID=A0ABW0W4X5_9BACL